MSKKGEMAPSDVFEEIWVKAEHALSAVFDKTTFSALAEKDRLKASQSAANYVI
jgi:hypothetical protein